MSHHGIAASQLHVCGAICTHWPSHAGPLTQYPRCMSKWQPCVCVGLGVVVGATVVGVAVVATVVSVAVVPVAVVLVAVVFIAVVCAAVVLALVVGAGVVAGAFVVVAGAVHMFFT